MLSDCQCVGYVTYFILYRDSLILTPSSQDQHVLYIARSPSNKHNRNAETLLVGLERERESIYIVPR